jgi:hypothetical protein
MPVLGKSSARMSFWTAERQSNGIFSATTVNRLSTFSGRPADGTKRPRHTVQFPWTAIFCSVLFLDGRFRRALAIAVYASRCRFSRGG